MRRAGWQALAGGLAENGSWTRESGARCAPESRYTDKAVRLALAFFFFLDLGSWGWLEPWGSGVGAASVGSVVNKDTR